MISLMIMDGLNIHILMEQNFQSVFSRAWKKPRANVDQAAIKAEEQAENIKEQFMKEFEELDKILEKKLRELKACAEDNENVEQRLYASKAKLNWLEDIQNRIRSILDI